MRLKQLTIIFLKKLDNNKESIDNKNNNNKKGVEIDIY